MIIKQVRLRHIIYCWIALLIIGCGNIVFAQKSASSVGKNNTHVAVYKNSSGNVNLQIVAMDKATIDNHQWLKGNWLAVTVSLVSTVQEEVMSFNGNNVYLVLDDGSKMPAWVAWFPDRSLNPSGLMIVVNGGSMVSFKLDINGKAINDIYKQSGAVLAGYGSVLMVQNEMELAYNMAYLIRGLTDKLNITLLKANDKNSIMFLFPTDIIVEKGLKIKAVHLNEFGEFPVKQ